MSKKHFLSESGLFRQPPQPEEMKSGQLSGQVFIYVMTIVIVAIVLGFGYNAVVSFSQKEEQITRIKFQRDLQNAIESLQSDYGSIKKKELLFSDFKQICFARSFGSTTLNVPSGIDPLVADSIRSGVDENIFLLKDTLEDSFRVSNIILSVDNVPVDVICIAPELGRVTLKLEGKGDHVQVSLWGR